MSQRFFSGKDRYYQLDRWLFGRKVMVVCGSSYQHIRKTKDIIDSHDNIVYFRHFNPNPVYESVVEGVNIFNKEHCDAIVAVGGGSAIDVAKCIKLFHCMDPTQSYLKQPITANDIPLLVVPTTAGTGSESTRYAVIYLDGIKQSITSDYCIPETVLLDPDNLNTLPEYQRKATMMDTLAHALESMWSINSSPESMEYSKKALELFIQNKDGYLKNTYSGNKGMQMAANIAGKAINITQTTAGHAMSYKITSMFGCAHGHAAMLCNRALFPWMLGHMDRCIDPRGKNYLEGVFCQISRSIETSGAEEASIKIVELFDMLSLNTPRATPEQIGELSMSVSVDRLKNNPVELCNEDLILLYHQILC